MEGPSPVPAHDYPEYETPPKQYEKGQITYFEVIIGLQRPYHNTGLPWWVAYAEVWEIRGNPGSTN